MYYAVWTGAIHYNTDNIHVHIAMVETEPSREKYFYKYKDGQPLVNPKTNEPVWEYKGKLNQKSLELVKSQVANALTKQSEMLTELSLLSRNKLGNKEEMFIRLEEDKELQEKFKAIHEHLPKDRRLWKYNNNAMKEIRPLLGVFSFTYLSKYKTDDLKQFNELLDKTVSS